MQEVQQDNLELKFDTRTIEHLGVQMYKTLPPVLSELISNSYDADATLVNINFSENQGEKQIVVTDNGKGMTFEEINENFLIIGKNRRKDNKYEKNISRGGRKVTGRKGLGKLAVFGIANKIQIETVKDGIKNAFTLDLGNILNSSNGIYNPEVICKNENVESDSGTKIILSEIKRKTPFDLEEIRASISKRFDFTGDDFLIELTEQGIQTPLYIRNDTKWEYISPQFTWEFPEENDDFAISNNVTGKILTTETPLKEDQRGIFLYARGKLVNPNEFYGLKATSSLAYNYMTGVFYVDFIDEYETDLITTNRDGLIWEKEELQALRNWIKQQIHNVEKQWRTKRAEVKEKKIKETTGINLNEWTNTMPKRLEKGITQIVTNIVAKDEIDGEITSNLVNELYSIVPQYPFYHWRELHNEIKDASEKHYKNRDYYNAFLEACKRYKNAVKSKSKVLADEDYKIMIDSFGSGVGKLRVTAKYIKRPNGEDFSPSTLENIEKGQMFFSQGVVTGARNVLSHEEHNDLRETGLFSEKNCLDVLSILSHLFERLDDTES